MDKKPVFTVKFKETDDGYTELEIGTPETEDSDGLIDLVDQLKLILDLIISKERAVRTTNDLISLQPSNKLNRLYLEDLDSVSIEYSSSGLYSMAITKGSVVRNFTVSAPVKYINTTDGGHEIYSKADPVLQNIRR